MSSRLISPGSFHLVSSHFASYTIFSCLIRLPYNIVFFHPVSSHLPLFSSLSSSLFSPCPLLSPYLDLPRQISLSSLAILVYRFFSYSQDITCIVSSYRLISPRFVSISFLAIPYHLAFFSPTNSIAICLRCLFRRSGGGTLWPKVEYSRVSNVLTVTAGHTWSIGCLHLQVRLNNKH